MLNKEKISFIADACIILLFGILIVWLTFGRLFSILLPFMIAYLIGLLIRRPVRFIVRKTRIPAGVVSVVLVIGTVGLACFGIWTGANRLLYELGDLISSLGESNSSFGDNVDSIMSAFDSVTSRIPALQGSSDGLRRMCTAIDEFVKSSVNEFVGKLSDDLGAFVASTLKSLPETFLYILITVIASVYITASFDQVNSFLLSLVPVKYRNTLDNIGKSSSSTVKQYLRAYSLIWLITFGELFFGFSLMRVRYSFVIALLIAFVDILPIFGVGTVLIPWAIVSFLMNDSRMFTSLIILYAVITIVRQIAEPKIVGHSIGLNPLVTLLSMFAGYRLIGVFGMLLFPALAVIAFGVYKNTRKNAENAHEVAQSS